MRDVREALPLRSSVLIGVGLLGVEPSFSWPPARRISVFLEPVEPAEPVISYGVSCRVPTVGGDLSGLAGG